MDVNANPEQKERYGSIMIRRIEKGGHRDAYLKIGASGEEVDMMIRDWKRWIEDVDGWMCIVNCEVVCEV